jgi:hypothetical protein
MKKARAGPATGVARHRRAGRWQQRGERVARQAPRAQVVSTSCMALKLTG